MAGWSLDCSRMCLMSPKRDARRGPRTGRVPRGRSEVLAESLLCVHRGLLLLLSSGAVPPEPAVPCPGSWASGSAWGCPALRGLSAGDLLQGPQGRLQGHSHSVADGFGVVWHRLTGALEGGEGGAYLLIIY